MNSMIQTVDLTKKFNDFVANDHINLDVKEQEIKCIVGENGAGKSTMMNMLYGLLQPTSGKILIRGKEVTLNSPVDAIANGIGMVHQHFKLVPSLTVYENILLGAEITQKKGGMKTPFIDQKEEIKRVEKLIQENHLELNATDKIEDISVGGRQRVEILKMLYRNVDILILDEPTAGLDVEARNEILDMLRAYIAEDESRSILITSHISTDLESLCDELYLIHDGKLILHEGTDAILEQYGILKVSEEQYRTLDQSSILKVQKENYGYACFTNDKKFYQENYPQIAVENGGIDELILMMTGGYR